MQYEESIIQQHCVAEFRWRHPRFSSLLFAVPNGARRSARSGAKYKAEGMVAGVADLLLLVPNSSYHGLCIEMKKKGGYQQPTQKAWQAAVEEQGYKYIVCRSEEEFFQETEAYLRG